MNRRFALAGAVLASMLCAVAPAQQEQPELALSAEQVRDDEARLSLALQAVRPQRPGVVDAYVVVVALDSDPVFNREAREAGRVLAHRFDAAGRTVVLAADEGGDKGQAAGSPQHMAAALARAAEQMDLKEDVIVLYTTSHGSSRSGLNYRDVERGRSVITPQQLSALLAERRFENRLIILQACFSGQFVPALAGPRTVIATASAEFRSSFGCSADNDWTFFGHALINRAMRQHDTFVRQFRRAVVSIYGWEKQLGFEPSDPQISVGAATSEWLAALDERARRAANDPVGRPPSELGEIEQ